MAILSYKDSQFYLDSKPFTVISGAMHYFRIPREYWHDRLLKLRECGFNTVETYTPWNLHERREGIFDFSDNLDIEAYIKEAADLGLHVILRPGPYICAEWDMGGLPSWLLTYEKMNLRCYDELFLSKVRRYYRELLGRIRPYLAKHGGNIFMLQIENEYGSFGNDKSYLEEIVKIYLENDIDCLFFTSDGPTYSMLSGGSLDGYLAVANFGSKPKENLEFLKEMFPSQPLMCGEYWCGWFDHWFEEHHVRPAEEIVSDVRDFADIGASFNFYMFHGGTNFAFYNGANHIKKYEPTVTSYDYNAPLNEAGDRTKLYFDMREIIEKRYGNLPSMTAQDSEKCAYGTVELTQAAPLFENLDNLSSPVFSPVPEYMEDIGQDFGYILYKTTLQGPSDGWEMAIDTVHDRAQIFADGKHLTTINRWEPETKEHTHVGFPLKKEESTSLMILCENMGRINYGPKIRDKKGIKGVRFGNQYHFGWEMYPLTMDDLSHLSFSPICSECFPTSSPVFLKGELEISGEPCDTFLLIEGGTKGFVTVNGRNIGRYFMTAGPQKTLYVPAPYLKPGKNEIIVFESDSISSPTIEFVGEAIL